MLAVTTAAGIWCAGRWIDPTGDPGVWWSVAYRMGNGERPYRDLFLQYGPLSPYLLAVTGRPFAFSKTWFLLVNWAPAILAGFLVLRAARPFLSRAERLALVGLLIGLSLFAPRPARMVLPYSPAAVLGLCFGIAAFLFLPSRSRKPFAAVAAGGLAGLAFCAKQEIGVAAMAGLCAPILTEGRRGFSWVLRCGAGFLAVVGVGVAVVLGSGASVDSLRHESHLWPLASVPREWKGLFRAVAGVDTATWRSFLLVAVLQLSKLILLVSLAGLCLGREKTLRRWLRVLVPLSLLLLFDLFQGRDLLPQVRPIGLSMSVALLVALVAWLDRQRPGRDFLVGFGVFAGLVGVRTAFSWDVSSPYSGVTHLATCLTWMLFLFCIIPERLPGGAAPARFARTAWLVVLVPIAWYGAANGIADLRETDRFDITTPRGHIFPDRRFALAYERIGKELRPGERALFIPETHGLDALFGVADSSPFLGHLPGWLDSRAEDALLRRFETSPPDVVVIFNRPTAEFGVKPFGSGYGVKLARWIESGYQPVASLPAFAILRPKKPLSSVPIH